MPLPADDAAPAAPASPTGRAAAGTAQARLAWIDVAKGFCLLAVVTLYTTTHVTEGLGRGSWMQAWVAFAAPFRMPDFFFVSGLLLGRVIDRPWRDYLDRKVLHYLWFFFVWSALYFALRTVTGVVPEGARGAEFVKSMTWGPFAMLWFIQMLPLYLLLARLLRRLPWPWVLAGAAVWHWLPIDTPWTQVDRAGERFVFFYAGYALAPWVLRFATWVAAWPRQAWGLIAAWALGNGTAVAAGGSHQHPMPLLLGLAGAMGVIAVSVQLQDRAAGRWLQAVGARSLPIFLGFLLPMSALNRAWLSISAGTPWRAFDAGLLALLLAAASIGLALLAWRLLRASRLSWLYVRPAWARCASRRAPAAATTAARAAASAAPLRGLPRAHAGAVERPVHARQGHQRPQRAADHDPDDAAAPAVVFARGAAPRVAFAEQVAVRPRGQPEGDAEGEEQVQR